MENSTSLLTPQREATLSALTPPAQILGDSWTKPRRGWIEARVALVGWGLMMKRRAMTETRVYQERQLSLPDENLILTGHDAEWALDAIDDEAVNCLCLRRGMIAEPRTVEITAEIVQKREFRYGWNGGLRERCAKRTERVVEIDPRLKLWHTKRRGWYWIEEKTND